MLRAADETGLGKALQRHLPALDPLRATWQLIAQILGRAERPLSREGMAQWIPESVLPFLAGDAAEASGRALRRSLRNLFGTDMETDAGEPILTRTRVRAIEAEVFQTLVAKGFDPRYLLYDLPNFSTYHEVGGVFQREPSKDKRFDKNRVGLGLVTLGNLPLVSKIARRSRSSARWWTRSLSA